MQKFGIEFEPGVMPERHELKTAEILAKYGDVKFLRPSRIKGMRSPDIEWLGEK